MGRFTVIVLLFIMCSCGIKVPQEVPGLCNSFDLPLLDIDESSRNTTVQGIHFEITPFLIYHEFHKESERDILAIDSVIQILNDRFQGMYIFHRGEIFTTTVDEIYLEDIRHDAKREREFTKGKLEGGTITWFIIPSIGNNSGYTPVPMPEDYNLLIGVDESYDCVFTNFNQLRKIPSFSLYHEMGHFFGLKDRPSGPYDMSYDCCRYGYQDNEFGIMSQFGKMYRSHLIK